MSGGKLGCRWSNQLLLVPAPPSGAVGGSDGGDGDGGGDGGGDGDGALMKRHQWCDALVNRYFSIYFFLSKQSVEAAWGWRGDDAVSTVDKKKKNCLKK